MFVSDLQNAADRTTPPDPSPDQADAGRASGRTAGLLDLVRRLIAYGKELAHTLRYSPSPRDHIATLHFGSVDIALILAHITRGLLRAAALEARLVKRLARQEKAAAARVPAQRKPRPAAPAAAAKHAREADSPLVHLPTPGEIAAEVRRRAIGAVLADICRDLGIVPAHPLWRELMLPILENRGNYTALWKDTHERVLSRISDPPPGPPPAWPSPNLPYSAWLSPSLPAPAAGGTGPP